MAGELNVSILSPAKVVAKTKASQVQVPGTLGYLGVLPGHARLVSEIGIGELVLEGAEGGRQVYFVAGGYVDVANDQVTVLVDIIEKPANIDVARAEKAKKRALERLERSTGEVDVARAQEALRRAQQRLITAQLTKPVH